MKRFTLLKKLRFTLPKALCLSMFILLAFMASAEDPLSEGTHRDHDDERDTPSSEHDELVSLSAAQQAMAGIVVKTLTKEHLVQQIYAPGEVVNNQYHSLQLAPKVASQVVKRHIVLGQEVKAGDVLVTLYSGDMAEAQGNLQISFQEWRRVKDLGSKSVGAKRFTEANIAYAQAHDRALAYGMSSSEIDLLLRNDHNDPHKDYRLGEFELVATQKGVVLSDSFSLGQTIVAGTTIIELVDDSSVWVEASLAPELGLKLPTGTLALIKIQGLTFQGTVIQQAHLIDETTRTRKVRLLVDNPDHTLLAGLFADIYFTLPLAESALAVPESALMRSSDGDWTVFIEERPGKFKQVEVDIQQSVQNLKVITGIAPNLRVAVEGAFFIASEKAKGSFAPDND